MDSFGFGSGELGWELFHKNEHTAELYEALLTAGDHHGIGDFGTYALNSLRLEKGFRSWGFEVFYDGNLLMHFLTEQRPSSSGRILSC